MMNNKKYDFIFVGAGLYNATFARLAMDNGFTCLCIEKRDHVGGNIYDEVIDDINVHKYGAHIFHTSDEDVWKFVNKYVSFNNYINSPLANYGGEIYNLPFNMNTFHQMWNDVITPEDAISKINEKKSTFNHKPLNLEQQVLSLVGTKIYTKLIRGYTEKQWGKRCTELPPDIIKRIPLRFTYNNNYFNDKYQGIPNEGYTCLIQKLFDGCDMLLNTDFFDIDFEELKQKGGVLVYSGEIDRYFNFVYGKLEYRSLKFEHERKEVQNYQGNAVINYTSSLEPQTRIIEHKHFDVWNEHVQNLKHTIITKEYPLSYESRLDIEPYYPIPDEKNLELYKKYKVWGESLPGVIFGGRLAEYKYYDMDKVVRSAMDRFNEYMKKKSEE